MDPSQMSDEELTSAINGDQPEETPTNEEAPVASPSESKQEEAPEQSTETVAEEAGQPAEPEQAQAPAMSRREQLRVADLLKRYGQPPVDKPAEPLSFRDKIDAEDEVIKTLDDTANQYGQSQFNQGVAVAQYNTWHRFLRMEDGQVRAKYPELDPSNKEQFHSALADAMNRKYLRTIGHNYGDPARGIPPSVQDSDLGYAEFVEAEMEYADEIASLKVAATTQNIAKQAAQTALRPDGSAAKGLDLSKHPSEMTDEELNAVINAAPRDSRGRFTAR